MSGAPASVRTPRTRARSQRSVAALSAAFGVGLLQVIGFMSAAIAGDDVTGSAATPSR